MRQRCVHTFGEELAVADGGERPDRDFGFALAEIAADAALGKQPDGPLLHLLSSVGPAEAAVITRLDQVTGRLRVGAVFGYSPHTVKPMTSTAFLLRDPAYVSILRDPARPPIRWWTDRDYTYDESPAARAILLPAGFRGGISIRLTAASGGHVGDFHMSTRRRFIPSESQLATFDRSLKIVASVLGSRAVADSGSGTAIRLVEDGRTVHLGDERVRKEFAPLMPRLRGQAASRGCLRGGCSFRWLGPSRTWYRIDLQRVGARMRAEASPEAVPHHLTARELEVLDRLCVGATNGEVARRLCLSERTVAHHVERILEKLGVPTRTAAVAKAIYEGLLLSPPP